MYLSPRWAEDARKLFQARREWERKEEKACWRGQTTVEKGLWFFGFWFLVFVFHLCCFVFDF